jgi:hypothetical protein
VLTSVSFIVYDFLDVRNWPADGVSCSSGWTWRWTRTPSV